MSDAYPMATPIRRDDERRSEVGEGEQGGSRLYTLSSANFADVK